MAVAFDNCQQIAGNTTSLTITNFVTTGSDIALVVFVGVDAASNFGPACSYGSFGSLGALQQEAFVGRYQCAFVVTGVAAQTGDIVVSSLPGGGRQHVFAISFTGVTSFDALPTANSSTALANSSIATTSDAGDMVVDGITINETTAPTVDASQTVPSNGSISNASLSGAVSYESAASAMSWTHVSTSVTHQAVVLNQVASGDEYSGRGIGRGIGRGVMR